MQGTVSNFSHRLLSLVGFDPVKHSVKVETMAGLTTFLTMSYILAVNPLILGATGMDKGAIFSATIISAAIATLVMAFYAKLPYGLASGMGLNAFFAYTLVLAMGYTYQEALAVVLFEGIVFILLTLFKIRESIFNAIPKNLRYSISVGIGLFIAYIGLTNGKIIVTSNATVTSLGPWTSESIIAVAGIIVCGTLMSLKIRGALFYTIVGMTLIGIPFGVTKVPEDFSLVSMPQSMAPIAFNVDFSRFLTFDINYYIVVFTLLFMDLFDTLGTLIGASTSAGMIDEKTGQIQGMNRALMADAIGTTAGALCGTSTVTTYVESTTGIAVGGRTGLTSLTVALLFLVALFFSPFVMIIPQAATTSALVIVGAMMIKPIMKVDFSDMTEAVPSFITIITMPFTASISEGIVMGMLSYVAMKILSGRFKEISLAMYVLSVLFVLKFFSI